MTDSNAMVLSAVVAAYDFDGIETIVDVGGGHGSLIAAILKANPTMRGVLFDQANVISSAESTLRQEGVAGRCDLVGGDFLKIYRKMETLMSYRGSSMTGMMSTPTRP